MSDELTKEQAYEKLTPEKKAVMDAVLKNLETVGGLWKQGWISGAPESAITGKKYRGMNNIYLTLMSLQKGYKDNRWLTYNQMDSRGWKFKTDEEGNSLGKGAGVVIEFFEFRDRETKKKFDKGSLDGMDEEERREYMRDNVYPVRKYYRLFNADVIDGIPAKEEKELDPDGYNERAEDILSYWSDNEARIVCGGNSAYYIPSKDEIHIPQREKFLTLQEFYGTTLHEIGHSTGHETRLNRDLSGGFGSEKYAVEELRAEIASLFMEQELGVNVSEKHIENNSRYVKSWRDQIKENPNVLFTAIADADKISRYVIEREKAKESKKEIEYYSVVESEDELGDTVYAVYLTGEYGQTNRAINYNFSSKDALMSEFGKFKELPAWKDKRFEEVSFDELKAKSIEKAEAAEKDEKETEYILPSEIVARSMPKREKEDISGRGIESLTKMPDRDIVERAYATGSGEKFKTLYEGGTLYNSEEKDEQSLMSRIAAFCGDDREQLLRIFRSSGQYRAEKPNSFYEKLANKAIQVISRKKSEMQQNTIFTPRQKSGVNAKT